MIARANKNYNKEKIDKYVKRLAPINFAIAVTSGIEGALRPQRKVKSYMAKVRKMLGAADSPYIISLMRLIETQSKATIAAWCLNYAEMHILPIYQKYYQDDFRPEKALRAARDWFLGRVKLPEVKNIILNECHAAAREAEGNHAAQAAARALGQASAVFHTPTHSIGFVFYGAAAIAYDRIGSDKAPDVYDKIAAEECAKMEAALRVIAIPDEPNPAKIKWNC